MVVDLGMVVSMVMVVGMVFAIAVEWKTVKEWFALTGRGPPAKDKHAILKLPIQPVVLLPNAKSHVLPNRQNGQQHADQT